MDIQFFGLQNKCISYVDFIRKKILFWNAATLQFFELELFNIFTLLNE